MLTAWGQSGIIVSTPQPWTMTGNNVRHENLTTIATNSVSEYPLVIVNSASAYFETFPLQLRWNSIRFPDNDTSSLIFDASGYLQAGAGKSFYLYSPIEIGTEVNKRSLYIHGTLDYTSQSNIIIAVEGDSVSEAPDGGASRTNWPYQMLGRSSIFGNGTMFNYAVGGDTAAAMVGEYATQAHLARPKKLSDVGYFFLLAGGNDIGLSNSAATIYGNLKTIWAAARADNYKVCAFTMTYINAYATPGDTRGDNITNLNNLIISDTSLYDYLIRTDLILPDPTNTNWFQLDGTHHTPAGSAEIAKAVGRALEGNSGHMIVATGTNVSSGLTNYTTVLNPQGAAPIRFGGIVTNAVTVSTTNFLYLQVGTRTVKVILGDD